MEEPRIRKFPTEIFGYAYNNHSEAARNAQEAQYCHFTGATCNKPRKSEPHIKVGICSVGYRGKFLDHYEPVIICPNRFLEKVVFETVAKNYLSSWKNTKWVKEVGIGVGGNVDYVAVEMDDKSETIRDFLCVEFQAGGTTGTPWAAMLEFKKSRTFSHDSYKYGINWANEFMKTMMQQVYKKGKIIHSWGRQIIFIVQDLAIDYLHSAVDTSAMNQSHVDNEIHFVSFKMKWSETKWVLAYHRSISTNLEGINRILGGANSEYYPSEQEFMQNVYSKGRANEVF